MNAHDAFYALAVMRSKDCSSEFLALPMDQGSLVLHSFLNAIM